MNRTVKIASVLTASLFAASVLSSCGSSSGSFFPAQAASSKTPVLLVVDDEWDTDTGVNTTSFMLDKSTGALSAAVTPLNTGLEDPEAVVVHPNGHWAYIADDYASVTAANVTSTGAMTVINKITTENDSTLEDTNNGLAMSPDGKYLYRADCYNTVTAFSIDQSTGAVSFLAATTLPDANSYGDGVVAVKNAADNNQYLYVAGDNALYAYKINADGSLTSVNSAADNGFSYVTIAADHAGKYVYVTDWSGVIMQYKVGTGGAVSLNTVAASVTANGESPELNGIAVSGDDKYLYASDYYSGPHAFSINSNGTLTELSGSPFAIAQNTSSSVAVDPNNKYLAVTDGNAEIAPPAHIYVYAIGATGSLTDVTASTPLTTTQQNPSYVTFAYF